MRILLTGASGLIGGQLLAALRARGHTVVAAQRRPCTAAAHACGVPPSLAVDFADAPAPAWWLPHLQGVDVVINAVGILRERGRQSFAALHEQAPTALFRACAGSRVRLVVQVSALGAHAGARARYHRSKHAADAVLRALPVPSAIVQPSLVYAPQGTSAAFFNQLAVLPLWLLPAGRPQVQPVHIGDLVEAVVRLVEAAGSHAPPQGSRTVACVGPAPLALGDYLDQLRHALGAGARPPMVALPQRLCLALGQLAGHWPGSLVDRETVGMLLQGNTADAGAFAALLGRAPRPVAAFLAPGTAEPARQQAWLAWLLPLLRLAVALVWIWTALVSLGLYPVAQSLQLLAEFGLHGPCGGGGAVHRRAVRSGAGRAGARGATALARLDLGGATGPHRRLHAAHHLAPAAVVAAPVWTAVEEPADAGGHRSALGAGAAAARRRAQRLTHPTNPVSPMEYLIAKWLHILSSTLLFGTGIGTAFYLLVATLSRDLHLLAGVSRWVVRADWLFTATTAVAQPLTGLWLAHLAGMALSARWLAWSLLLYALAIACWLPVVWLQMRLRDLAAQGLAQGRLPRAYWRFFAAWVALGMPALLAFLAIFWLMVAKPV